jgi:hypothetical protein
MCYPVVKSKKEKKMSIKENDLVIVLKTAKHHAGEPLKGDLLGVVSEAFETRDKAAVKTEQGHFIVYSDGIILLAENVPSELQDDPVAAFNHLLPKIIINIAKVNLFKEMKEV